MAYDNVLYPLSVEQFTSAKEFLTQITETQGGSETRVSWWDDPKVQFNGSASMRSLKDLIAVHDFHILRGGRARSFPVKDLLDFQQSRDGSSVEIAIGDGSPHAYQLFKVYSDTANSYTRPITKPIPETLRVFFNTTEKFEGTDWSCDYLTGLLTTTVPNTQALSVLFEFYVPVRFDVDTLPVDEIYALFNYGVDEWTLKDGSVDLPVIPLVEVRNE